jgi:hypothetical protein
MSAAMKNAPLPRAALLIKRANLSRAYGIGVPGKPVAVKIENRHLFPCPVGVSFERTARDLRHVFRPLLRDVSVFGVRDLWRRSD